MGVMGSKFDMDDSFQSENGSGYDSKPPNQGIPSTPISTPTPWSLLDPRSPTANIARTPLEEVLASKARKTGRIETDIGNDRVLISLDPRSPTVEFIRTPLIVEATPKSKLHNKNLDNARKSLIPSPRIIPPRLLDSSPITRHSNTALKRRSMVGLLETNIDFTETDLDKVFNKTLPDRVDAVTPLSNKIQSQTDLLRGVPPSLDFGLEDNPEIVVTPADKEETVIPVSVPEVNVTAHVKDFEKKLTTLIYEDDSIPISVKVVKAKETNRTPLADRNLNGEAKKSVSKLKVSDKPRKLERTSKIPVFKEKRISRVGAHLNCENTPPTFIGNFDNNKSGTKTRYSHWDADKTVTI